MKRLILIFLPLLFLPTIVSAATIPEASDVVLIYNNASEENQDKFNFVFRVNGDAFVYACEANRCSTQQFSDKQSVTLTIYKLPDGFPRPDTIVDQTKLVEYAEKADQIYTLESVPTNLSSESEGRPYQIVYLNPDGSFESTSATYDKPLIKIKRDEDEVINKFPWFPALIGLLIIVAVSATGVLIWRIKK